MRRLTNVSVYGAAPPSVQMSSEIRSTRGLTEQGSPGRRAMAQSLVAGTTETQSQLAQQPATPSGREKADGPGKLPWWRVLCGCGTPPPGKSSGDTLVGARSLALVWGIQAILV